MKWYAFLSLFLSLASSSGQQPSASGSPSVRIVSGDPYRAIIQWDPNPKEQEIYGYFVYLIRMDHPNAVNKRLFTTDTWVDVVDFEPGVEYSVAVSAVNIYYIEGPACAPIRFFPSSKSLLDSVLWRAERVGDHGTLQMSRDLRSWETVTSPFTFDRRKEPKMFLRITHQ